MSKTENVAFNVVFGVIILAGGFVIPLFFIAASLFSTRMFGLAESGTIGERVAVGALGVVFVAAFWLWQWAGYKYRRDANTK